LLSRTTPTLCLYIRTVEFHRPKLSGSQTRGIATTQKKARRLESPLVRARAALQSKRRERGKKRRKVGVPIRSLFCTFHPMTSVARCLDQSLVIAQSVQCDRQVRHCYWRWLFPGRETLYSQYRNTNNDGLQKETKARDRLAQRAGPDSDTRSLCVTMTTTLGHLRWPCSFLLFCVLRSRKTVKTVKK
jgi:hypothetical protein